MAQTPNEVLKEISSLLTILVEHGIAIDTNPAIRRQENQAVVITWPTRFGATGFSGLFASIPEYRKAVTERHYNCILMDGSLLQFSYIFRYDRLIKHRLCYYPCPVLIPPDYIQLGDDLIEILTLFLENELTLSRNNETNEASLRLRTPLRFDFDEEATRAGHSSCHLHLLNDDARWPVFAPLSVGHFVRFVFRHFYPQVWQASNFLREWPLNAYQRVIVPQDEAELFVDCRQATSI